MLNGEYGLELMTLLLSALSFIVALALRDLIKSLKESLFLEKSVAFNLVYFVIMIALAGFLSYKFSRQRKQKL